MPRIAYRDQKFHAASIKIVEQANDICATYRAQGYDLTLRQLYYQFVARDLLANNDKNYKRLGNIVNDARLAGLMDWNYIVDRTRRVTEVPSWEDPGHGLESIAAQYRERLWAAQPSYVEVWVEKDALVGVIKQTCDRLRVPYVSCRGYTSQSEMWRAGGRMLNKMRAGKNVLVVHLGDHDPSGLDMTRDIEERLAMFALDDVEVRRIALNMDQVREYDPPPNPAKLTDSRCEGYIREYGNESWELDALEPSVLDQLIEDEIETVLDRGQWELDTEREQEARNKLAMLSDRWSEVDERWDDIVELLDA